jgi:hypothetical protein
MSEGRIVEDLLETIGWLARRALPANDFDVNYSLLNSVFPQGCFEAANRVLRQPNAPLPSRNRFLRRFGELRKPRIFSF